MASKEAKRKSSTPVRAPGAPTAVTLPLAGTRPRFGSPMANTMPMPPMASAARVTRAARRRRVTPGAYRSPETPSPEHRAGRRRRLDAQPVGHEDRDDRRMPHRGHGDRRAASVGRERPLDRQPVEVGRRVA